MQERAELLAGFLTVLPDPAGGTVVTLDIPLPQPESPEGEAFIPEEAASPQA
jgi:hypothetical protein